MTNRATITLILIILALGLGAYLVWGRNTSTPDSTYATPSYGTPATSTTTNATSTNTGNSNLIRVTSPATNSSVVSPLVITGQARGTWYFEASFPVRILDGNGKELGVSHAEAQSDWMTTEFVPFRATLNFATSTTPTGTLVLEKDNPSGLPQNAAEIRIPIRFSQNTSSLELRLVLNTTYDRN